MEDGHQNTGRVSPFSDPSDDTSSSRPLAQSIPNKKLLSSKSFLQPKHTWPNLIPYLKGKVSSSQHDIFLSVDMTHFTMHNHLPLQ